ncbi:MFS transporter [Novosphingobium sp. 9U]|uniref:spinster family MFS transporter n=1 Tax=Novosphingobium sp. 9U TaxID=2653158 RepID=UPI001358A06E|nr:MFS transporter [Novosphingobium sp. 9U]
MIQPKDVSERQAHWALFVLCLVALFNFLDRSLLSILQIPIKTELGLSDGQLGALTGLAFTICYAFSAVPLARLVDRGRRTLILGVALALWTSMTALSALAFSFASLVILRVGVALGEAAATPATHSLIADYFPPEKRGKAFALWALALPIGMMIGLFAGGFFGQDLGWRASFALTGATGLLIFPMVLLQPEPRRGRFEPGGVAPQQVGLVAGLGLLWRNHAFRYLVLGTSLQGLTYSTAIAWLAPFYSRVHGLDLSHVAITVALIVGVGASVGSFAGGMIQDRLIVRDVRWYGRWPALTSLGCLPLLGAQLFAHSYGAAVTFGLLGMLVGSVYVSTVNAAAQAMVSSNIRGLTSAVLLVIPALVGAGCGPWITGMLSDWFTDDFAMGVQAIRWALMIAFMASAVAAPLLWKVGSAMAADLERSAP